MWPWKLKKITPNLPSVHKLGHIALKCYHRFDQAYEEYQPDQIEAFMTSNSIPQDQIWYPDTLATHHLTSNVGNLTFAIDEYVGNNQICIGNWVGLPICHTGSSHFFSFSKLLFL